MNKKDLVLFLSGIIIIVGFMYIVQDESSLNTEVLDSRTQKDLKAESVYEEDKKEKIEDKRYKDKIVTKSQIKEVLKTPDELYEEQEALKNYTEVKESIPIEIDKTVMPDELVESEMQMVSNDLPYIDTSLVPEELQELEANGETSLDPITEEENRELDYDVDNEELEVIDPIPDNLKVLEEYGDSENITYEDNIPN